MNIHAYLPTKNTVVRRNVHGGALQVGAVYLLHDTVQSAASALFRDPDAIGVTWSPTLGVAQKLVREWRTADIANLLVTLLHVDIAHHTAFSVLLNAGADDVQDDRLTATEIAARMDALSRRMRVVSDIIRFCGWSLDPGSGTLSTDGKSVALTRHECEVLRLLVERGSVVTKRMLLDRLYGGRDEPEAKIIDVFICKVRRKAALIGGHGLIETVWGRGYRLADASDIHRGVAS